MFHVSVDDYFYPSGWSSSVQGSDRARHYCAELERGTVLLFPRAPFDLPQGDIEFLSSQSVAASVAHKNISFLPRTGALRGTPTGNGLRERMGDILRRFSKGATEFVADFLSPYRAQLTPDYANLRPFEEEGRKLPRHKRNDLLHVDASHSRPTRGGRILRVFVNINPSRTRIWHTSTRFPELARQYAWQAGLRKIAQPDLWGRLQARRRLSQLGLPIADRAPYDTFMLRFHDFLKDSDEFQETCPRFVHEFPPLSTWLVFSDGVPHAVLSGQGALDQTFVIPMERLVDPEASPLKILEKMCGRTLAGSRRGESQRCA